MVAVAEENTRAPLRTTERSRLFAVRVGVLFQRRYQRHRPCVVERLENFQEFSVVPYRRRDISQTITLNTNIHPRVKDDGPLRPVARVDVERREPPRYTAECVKRQRRDRLDLITLSGDQSSAKSLVEEILSAN